MAYLYWVYRNNLTFLRRHRSYLRRTHPEALALGSPLLSAGLNLAYRSAWLARVEVRRAISVRLSNAASHKPHEQLS